jgi:V8-like Glu-specific endopeptidase
MSINMNTFAMVRRLSAATLTSAAALLAPLSAHALVGGTDTSSFSAVGELGAATGVLISDNWVLTVNHVAAGVTAGSSSFVALSGSSVVDAVYQFTTAAFPNNDIALLHLSTALSSSGAPVLNDAVLKSSTLSSLGTLTVATAANQTPNGEGNVTAQQLMATYKDNAGVSYTTNWIVTGGAVHVEGGDSGSGLFKGAVNDSAGALLLGLASAALTESTGSQLSAFVQVATYKTWIDSTMASSGQKATWLSAVPEPSTLALSALGLVGVLTTCRRRLQQEQAA